MQYSKAKSDLSIFDRMKIEQMACMEKLTEIMINCPLKGQTIFLIIKKVNIESKRNKNCFMENFSGSDLSRCISRTCIRR
jgi:hypothetical protein